jgi:hypothetical protein
MRIIEDRNHSCAYLKIVVKCSSKLDAKVRGVVQSLLTTRDRRAAKEPSKINVANLMDASRQSLQAERGIAAKATKAPAMRGKKRIDGQREMLLPIPAKKETAGATKAPGQSEGRQRKTRKLLSFGGQSWFCLHAATQTAFMGS